MYMDIIEHAADISQCCVRTISSSESAIVYWYAFVMYPTEYHCEEHVMHLATHILCSTSLKSFSYDHFWDEELFQEFGYYMLLKFKKMLL